MRKRNNESEDSAWPTRSDKSSIIRLPRHNAYIRFTSLAQEYALSTVGYVIEGCYCGKENKGKGDCRSK
jgi:hypothetical protein